MYLAPVIKMLRFLGNTKDTRGLFLFCMAVNSRHLKRCNQRTQAEIKPSLRFVFKILSYIFNYYIGVVTEENRKANGFNGF